MKNLFSCILVLASILLGGCANSHYQNMVEGTLIGGAVGALLGNSSRAAGIGAGVGLLAGAAAPVRSQDGYPAQYPNQVYGQPYVPAQQIRETCAWVGHDSFGRPQFRCAGCPVYQHYDGRGCLPGSYGPNTMVPGSVPAPTTYGYPQPVQPMPPGTWTSNPAICPRVMVPGGGWRCQ